MSNNNYGAMPMSQGALLYKGMSKQMSYENKLQKLANDNAIQYALVYGNSQNGMVKEFLNSAESAASNAGDAIREDARCSIVEAAVGGVAVLGTIGGAFATKTGAIDEKIDSAKLVKTKLNTPPEHDLVLRQPNAKPTNAEVNARVAKWKGGDYSDLGSKDAHELDINDQAAEASKSAANKDDVNKSLDKHIEDLQREKGRLDSRFQTMSQFLTNTNTAASGAAKTPFLFKKADEQAASTRNQSVSQIEQNVAQKQAEFVSQQYQAAAQNQQAANSIAASYANIHSPA